MTLSQSLGANGSIGCVLIFRFFSDSPGLSFDIFLALKFLWAKQNARKVRIQLGLVLGIL